MAGPTGQEMFEKELVTQFPRRGATPQHRGHTGKGWGGAGRAGQAGLGWCSLNNFSRLRGIDTVLNCQLVSGVIRAGG